MEARFSTRVAEHISWRELVAPDIKPIQTEVVVLTGTQCSGKTTMIRQLDGRGFSVISEGIRELMEEGAKLGIPINELKHALPEVTMTCLARHVEKLFSASQLITNKCTISDRGFGDFLAALKILRYAAATPQLFRSLIPLIFGESEYWAFLADQNMPELRRTIDRQINNLKECAKKFRYQNVFWLESMPFLERDGIRAENPLVQKLVACFIQTSWRELGYKMQRVPAFYEHLPERVDFLFQRLPIPIST